MTPPSYSSGESESGHSPQNPADGNRPPVNIELPASIAQGVYSNFVIVVHSPAEFVIDFASVMPGVPKPQVRARIIMTPAHVKRFLQVLQENISRYEEAFGTIQVPPEMGGPPGHAGGFFEGPAGKA